jgi:hypothetical protein
MRIEHTLIENQNGEPFLVRVLNKTLQAEDGTRVLDTSHSLCGKNNFFCRHSADQSRPSEGQGMCFLDLG